MRLYLSVVFLGLLASLTACQSLINEVDPERLPKMDGKLSVQCYISPQDTLLLATVSVSQPVLGTGGQGGLSQKVFLSEGDRSIELKFDNRLYNFTASPKDFPIEAGKTYHLRVQWGEQSVTASCTVPEAIPIASVKIDSTRQTSDFYPNQPWIYETRLTWQDPAGQENYYRLAGDVSLSQWVTLAPYVPGQTTQDTIQRYISMRGTVFFDHIEQHLSDRNRDGQLISSPRGILPGYLNYQYHDPVRNWNFGGNAPISKRPVTINTMLLHVDQNYYHYHRTLRQQDEIKDNPFAEPVLIFSNIEGGLGCFGAYNRSTLTITLN